MPRKQRSIHYIYKTTNLINNKYYLGMHSAHTIDDGYLGSGTKLRNSIRKYGAENFKREILEFVDSKELLKQREKDFITQEVLEDPLCMNLQLGGGGGFISIEVQRKRSVAGGLATAKKLKEDKDYFKIHSEKSSNRLKQRHRLGKVKIPDTTGFKHSEETKAKMSLNRKGKYVGEKSQHFNTCWINKEGKFRKVKKDTLNSFITLGWNKGRK